MSCRHCSYRFVLNPKQSPFISDGFLLKQIKTLSGQGHYYITVDQIVTGLMRAIQGKKNLYFAAKVIALLAALLIIVILYKSGDWGQSKLLNFLFIAVAVAGYFHFQSIRTRAGKARTDLSFAHLIVDTVRSYLEVHPHPKVVDGKRLEYNGSLPLQKELADYAPDRILIVQHNDLADMLVLNRFHFENKTLVLSASKYPGFIFKYYGECIRKFPDIPVHLIHDASPHGIKMKETLLKDPEWHLAGKNVWDLGLFQEDVAKMKRPIWLPAKAAGIKDMRIPVASLNSKAMLGTFSMAVFAGLALLSDELIEKGSRYADKIDGGYG
jgi:hypothetical protein